MEHVQLTGFGMLLSLVGGGIVIGFLLMRLLIRAVRQFIRIITN